MLKDEIKDYMRNTSFSLDEEDDNSLDYATRENGSVYDEEFGQADYQEALNIKKNLEASFEVEVHIDTCDEWVLLQIR